MERRSASSGRAASAGRSPAGRRDSACGGCLLGAGRGGRGGGPPAQPGQSPGVAGRRRSFGMSRRAVSVEVARLGPYSPAIVAEGRFAFVSGQGPLRDGRYEPGDGGGDETRLALENLFTILAAAGCGPSDVVRCGVFLTDIDDFDEMN